MSIPGIDEGGYTPYLYKKGGCGASHTPIYGYVKVAYRDKDGHSIPGAPADTTIRSADIGAGSHSATVSGSADLNTLDQLGWRYLGVKQNKGLNVGLNSAWSGGSSSTSFSVSVGFDASSKSLTYTVVFYFEPIKVTVKHINTDRTEIPTNKSGVTYELPKIINTVGHVDTDLKCGTETVNESGKTSGTRATFHNNTSLNKYLWPGYILTDYELKTVNGKQVQKKTYNTQVNEPLENATTRTATKEDMAKYGANIPKEMYQKTVKIPVDIDTGEKAGYRSDLELDFIYSNVDVKVNHYKYGTKQYMTAQNGENLTYVKTLNGHYFIVSSLVTRGTNTLTELGVQYNIEGYIIRRVEIIKQNKQVYAKDIEYGEKANGTEAVNATNLLYYVISSNDLDSDLMATINRIGSDVEFNFYYEQVPMLVVRHVDELGNKLWPDEYYPLVDPGVDTHSKDLTTFGYKYKEHTLDDVLQPDPNAGTGNEVRSQFVPKNGDQNREVVYVYEQNVPNLRVKYVDESENEIAEETNYKMDRDNVSTSAKDLTGSQSTTGKSYEYVYHNLYEEDTEKKEDRVLTPGHSENPDPNVTVPNTGVDRLLVFVYRQTEKPSIGPNVVTSESVTLRSNYRDTAEEYNVLRAIPTSEDLYANVITDSFLLSNVVRQEEIVKPVHVKLIQPYYKRNDTDNQYTGTSVSDKAYAIASSGYVNIEMPYSYFSARNVQLNIISRAVVKNGSIEVRDLNGNVKKVHQVTVTPNYGTEPTLTYQEGGKLVFKDLATPSMAGSVADYINGLAAGAYNLTTGFYNVSERDGEIYVEYVLPEIQYTEVKASDMAKIAKEYQDNPALLAKAAEDNDVRVTMDTLKVNRENGKVVTILSGAALPINREYTLIQLENMKDSDGNPIADLTPDEELISRDVLFKQDEIYIQNTAENREYITTADIYYRPKQRVNPETLLVEEITGNNDVFKGAGTFNVVEETANGEILIDSKKDVVGNSVFVHTPVVDRAVISENTGTQYNTILGSDRSDINTLVLGHEFTVRIPNNGNHINEIGYGNKAYNYDGLNPEANVMSGNEAQAQKLLNSKTSFAKDRQIRFTFGVMYGGQYYEVKADGYTQWISLGVSEQTDFKFTAPEWEEERWKGNNRHTIETRVIAENCTSDAKLAKVEENSNEDKNNYVAFKNIPVKLIGEIIDLEVRATNDPGWTRLNSSLSSGNLPLGEPGQNANSAYKYGIKLGYYAYFDITTTGWVGDTSTNINITPKYYFVSKNGGAATPVELWYKQSASGPYVRLADKPVTLTTVMNRDVPKGVNYVSRFAANPGKFVMDGARELSTTVTLLAKYGKTAVNYASQITTGSTKEIDLPYATRLAYMRAIERLATPDYYNMVLPTVTANRGDKPGTDYCIGHWYGAMALPSSTIPMDPTTDPDPTGSNRKKDGYIIVTFDHVHSENGEDPYLEHPKTGVPNENNPDPKVPDDKVDLPNGKQATIPNSDTEIPVVIYELIADKMDYGTAITH